MQTRTKESRKRLQSLILLTAFTCVLLIVSTYAWFTTQKDVNVSNIRGKVEVAEGLQISLDAKEWTQVLDLGNGIASGANAQEPNASLTENTYEYGPYEGHRNHVPDEFLPISTSGDILDVAAAELTAATNAATQELGMYAGKYEGDTTKKLGTVNRADETEDDVSADKYAGYYAFDIFLKNSSKTGITKDILQLNSDAAAWVLPDGESITVSGTSGDIEFKGNESSGLQNTIRVAFARYGAGESGTGVVSADANQATALADTKSQEITSVAIWEPNHNAHTEHIITNIGKLFPEGTNPLPASTTATATSFFTKTLSKDTTSLDNVFDWSNATLGTPNTIQTTSNDDVKPYTVEGVQNLKDIDGETDFTLAANSITRLRVYIYLEGQDPDCDNSASRGGGIEINLGLTKGEAEGSMDRYNELYDPDRTAYTAGS